eukprot:scaffold23271_cov27-Tisochrysis_lutea.AAC.4
MPPFAVRHALRGIGRARGGRLSLRDAGEGPMRAPDSYACQRDAGRAGGQREAKKSSKASSE